MISRKEKFKRTRLPKGKLLIGTVILTIGLGCSLNISFADQDIEGLLTNWAQKQRENSINVIESAISTEKEEQLLRLRGQLQEEIAKAEQELEHYTLSEKNKRVEAIQTHADELARNLTVDTSKEKAEIINKLDTIFNNALNEMDQVGTINSPTPSEKPLDNTELPASENTELPVTEPTPPKEESVVTEESEPTDFVQPTE